MIFGLFNASRLGFVLFLILFLVFARIAVSKGVK